MSLKNKNRIFWLITFFTPVFLFLIIELVLIVGGYEKEKQHLFVDAPNTPEYLIANNKYIERYFPSFVPVIAPNPFKKIKETNTFRIFVFGGSSTEGFPYNFYTSFPNQLKQQLLLNTEGLNIEVVNLGMTAVNSYVIHDLAKKVLPYDPDAILIYAGHNEYYGSFGAATTQFGFINSILIKRLILWLKNWRLFQMLEGVLQYDVDSKNINERRTMMAKVISQSNIIKDSEIYNHGIEQFLKNISDVVKIFENKKIPIFIGTIASNLKDQTPLGDSPEVLKTYQKAQMILKEDKPNAALVEFLKAKELDGTRFRAPEDINNVINEITTESSAKLIPIQELFRNKSISGIEDNSLFIDHLHPNQQGHKYIADSFFEAIIKLPKLQNYINLNPIRPPANISRFEKAYAEIRIARLLVGYPFEKNVDISDELKSFNRIFESYLNTNYIDSIAAIASKENIFIPIALTEVLSEARKRNDTLSIVEHSYDLLKWQLKSRSLIENSIEFTLNSGEKDGYLINILYKVINDGNKDPRYYDLLSSLYLLEENTQQAKYWLNQSELRTPSSPRLLYNFSRYHILNGDTLKAQEYFQKFLATQQKNQN